MANTNTIQPVDPPFFLICDNLTLIREVGIIPILCHIHQAVHIVPDFNGLQFGDNSRLRLDEIIRIIIAIVLPGNICGGILRKNMLFLEDILCREFSQYLPLFLAYRQYTPWFPRDED